MDGLNAIRKRIKEIVVIDDRPFSYLDVLGFELDGVSYTFAHGTIRNYFSKLTKSGEIEFAYNSGVAFYTLPGRNFTKQVTPHHVGDHSCSLLLQLPIKSTPIFRWIKNRRFDKTKTLSPSVMYVFLKNKSGSLYSETALPTCVSQRSAANTFMVSLPSSISI